MGAGGTTGGAGRFFLGFIMMCAGFYMLLNAITVRSGFHLGLGIYRFGVMGSSFSITSGMILIPFILGIGMIFYNSKNYIGWAVALGSLASLIFGVISTLRIGFRSMTAFDLIVIIILSFGGTGLFLSSLRESKK
ncbi:conserved membrane hypothetical protein [Desulfamplus magnetovallimortis]|uniref:Uncharacterized protein n=1 Tax=Desulfamplus magnetovallimortis TaxID=1246637 RepID=A0A1W1H5G2_9BACT|nr:hypothetical protein [Desulfamplus magnetovallimortis]SLM27615.1 conserved membrane hypothetical protein [Desulfamplus magnetovallimortis]